MAGIDEVESTGMRPRIHEEALNTRLFLEFRYAVLLVERGKANAVAVERPTENIQELSELGEHNRFGAGVFLPQPKQVLDQRIDLRRERRAVQSDVLYSCELVVAKLTVYTRILYLLR